MKAANVDDPISKFQGFTFKPGRHLLSTKLHNLKDRIQIRTRELRKTKLKRVMKCRGKFVEKCFLEVLEYAATLGIQFLVSAICSDKKTLL